MLARSEDRPGCHRPGFGKNYRLPDARLGKSCKIGDKSVFRVADETRRISRAALVARLRLVEATERFRVD